MDKNASITLEIKDVSISESLGVMNVTISSDEKDTVKLTGLMYAMMEAMRMTHAEFLGLTPKIDTSQIEVMAVRMLRETLGKLELRLPPEPEKKIGGGKPGRKWSEEAKQKLKERNAALKLKTQVESRNSEERPENQKSWITL